MPASHPASADKVALRRLGRDRRRTFVESLDRNEREALEQQLAGILAPLLAKAQVIGGYSPLPNEVSPTPALEAASANGAIVAYPAFADLQTDFRFLAGQPSESGPWVCLQPPLDAPEVHPDLVLVPLIAIDGKGTRLGQGKGHYDRVLRRLRERRALLIGIGWDVQRVDTIIPADPWDVPLDGFASPSGLDRFR